MIFFVGAFLFSNCWVHEFLAALIFQVVEHKVQFSKKAFERLCAKVAASLECQFDTPNPNFVNFPKYLEWYFFHKNIVKMQVEVKYECTIKNYLNPLWFRCCHFSCQINRIKKKLRSKMKWWLAMTIHGVSFYKKWFIRSNLLLVL